MIGPYFKLHGECVKLAYFAASNKITETGPAKQQIINLL